MQTLKTASYSWMSFLNLKLNTKLNYRLYQKHKQLKNNLKQFIIRRRRKEEYKQIIFHCHSFQSHQNS